MSTARPSARNRGTFLSAAPEPAEKKESRNLERKTSPPLVKVGWQVEPSKLEQLRLHAVKTKRKLYEVVDEAIGEYLQHRHQA